MRLAKRRKVNPNDPMAVVTRFLDAANHHDADTLYACVHPEFESFQPLHPDRNFRGPGQLISNWKAIFEAEPGFRLTVLRASTTGNTVWVELHGAGDSAEAAGIFIVGVENSRIRWVRVYSDLVQGVAPEEQPQPAPPVAAAPEPATVDAVTPSPGQADDTNGELVGSGALRLVDSTDESGPESEPAAEASADAGLRLVEPAVDVAGPGDGGGRPEPDAGRVETLVGPPRIVPPTEAPLTRPESDDLWLPPRADDHAGGGTDPLFGEQLPSETDTDETNSDATAGSDLDGDDSEPSTPDPTGGADSGSEPAGGESGHEVSSGDEVWSDDEQSGDDKDNEPESESEPESDRVTGVESFDAGSRPPEPRRSRWRKAMRKF